MDLSPVKHRKGLKSKLGGKKLSEHDGSRPLFMICMKGQQAQIFLHTALMVLHLKDSRFKAVKQWKKIATQA